MGKLVLKSNLIFSKKSSKEPKKFFAATKGVTIKETLKYKIPNTYIK
jgi:hypothetical protein